MDRDSSNPSISVKWEVAHFDVSGMVIRRRLTASQLEAQIRAALLSWVDYARPMIGAVREWRRLCEIPELRYIMPNLPHDVEQTRIEASPPPLRGSARRNARPSAASAPEVEEEIEVVADLTITAIKE